MARTTAPAVSEGSAPKYGVDNKKKFLEIFNKERKLSRSISPMYKPYFGNVATIMINGIHIYFPVDGTYHDVPESFAAEIDAKVAAVDASINKRSKMADIKENHETYAGEIKMF